MLELAVLGLLKEKPMHGYEVHSSLEERLGRNFSFGSIYPTLKRLTKRGALEVEEPHAAASLRSRKRILYHLTPAGEALFEQLLDEAGPHVAEDRDAFMMRLAFFGYTRPETRRRLLERRRGYLLEQLERMKASLKNLKERVDAYSLELMRYGESETMRELRWLDDRIAFEAASEDRKDRKAAMKAARKSERRVRRNATMHNKRDKETTDAPTVAPTAPAGADLGGAR